MNMKLRYYLNGLLAALLLATAACSTDELVKKDGEQPEIGADGTRTLKLRFEGFSIGTDKPGTKAGNAIATDEENLVDDLLMLIINSETGKTEVWHYSKDNLDEPDGVNKLLLEQDGKILNGVIKTKLTGTLGAVIFTNGLTLSPTEEPVKLEDWPLFVPADIINYNKYILSTKNADGIYRTRRTDLATQPITTPLPMFNIRIEIPENSTSTTIPLDRLVARFDLQNKIDNLRILRIIPRNAVDIESINPPEVPETRIDKMAPVSVYTDVDYDSDAAIASQKAAPLFYTNASALNETSKMQPMTFDVDAVYKDETGHWINKTYNLQLTRNGQQIEIDMNTRYTIVLTDATDQTLTGSILISDWNEGDQIDGGMGNIGAVPEFAFPAQAANMPTIQVGTSNRHILAVDPKATNSSIKLSIPNYKTSFETDAANTNNVLNHLSFDIVPLDGNKGNIWIKLAETSPFALNDQTLTCTFVAQTASTDSYAGEYPSLMIRVKNKANPAQYMAVKVVSWMMTESSSSLQDRYGNDGTEATPYEIRTTDDLLAMMGAPSYAFKDKYISLENDIDLSEYVFEKGVQAPAGYFNSSSVDAGISNCIFNGNNHTIRNFTLKRDISATGTDGSNPVHAIGFFSCKTKTSAISDLSITGSITVNAASGNYNYQVGGITSNPIGDLYINCHSHIDITVTDADPASHGNSATGGITSVSNSTLLCGSSNTGTIRSESPYVGGIIGTLMLDESIGDFPIVAGCFNSGTIISGSSSLAGGIAGVVTNANKIYISNCFNSSVIKGGKGGAFGGFIDKSNDTPTLIATNQTPAANIYRCFYNTTGSAYENTWGTTIESDAMKTRDFVNQLNDFSELLVSPNFEVLSPILNNCFQYKADSYPVLK